AGADVAGSPDVGGAALGRGGDRAQQHAGRRRAPRAGVGHAGRRRPRGRRRVPRGHPRGAGGRGPRPHAARPDAAPVIRGRVRASGLRGRRAGWDRSRDAVGPWHPAPRAISHDAVHTSGEEPVAIALRALGSQPDIRYVSVISSPPWGTGTHNRILLSTLLTEPDR